jgi:hypothetical protein
MNVEIGAEAALFPEKEYRNGIAIAVWVKIGWKTPAPQNLCFYSLRCS